MGTTVLQLKTIPPRPAEFDGQLCVFGLNGKYQGDEEALRSVLGAYGEISRVDFNAGRFTLVQFSTHANALAAAAAAAQLTHVCDGLSTFYNERSYDGLQGIDQGRGWVCLT